MNRRKAETLLDQFYPIAQRQKLLCNLITGLSKEMHSPVLVLKITEIFSRCAVRMGRPAFVSGNGNYPISIVITRFRLFSTRRRVSARPADSPSRNFSPSYSFRLLYFRRDRDNGPDRANRAPASAVTADCETALNTRERLRTAEMRSE